VVIDAGAQATPINLGATTGTFQLKQDGHFIGPLQVHDTSASNIASSTRPVQMGLSICTLGTQDTQ
jgi:hypothetical protein